MFQIKLHPTTRSQKRDLLANRNPGVEFIHTHIYIYIFFFLKYKIEKVCTEIILSLRKDI